MSKLKIILLSILILGLSICVGFSAYLIISTNLDVSFDNMVTTKHKVTFTDNGNIVKTMYVDNNYNLSLKDAPYYFNSNKAPIKWVEDDGTILNDFNDGVLTDKNFNMDNFSTNEIITESLQNGNGKTGLFQNGHENNISKFNNEYNSCYVYNASLTLYYNQDDELTSSRTNTIAWHGTQLPGIYQNDDLLNNDTYIGLQSDTNNCEYTLSLNRDIILTGNITVGGRTGFYGNNHSYSQINYQGFIVGDYSKLDLNGHDLIVGDPNDGAMLDAWGLVTDSSSNGEGTLVLDKNSTMYSVMVLEDIYHEKRMPYTYYTNDNIFSMYRCPYWQCKTIISSSANVYGKYMIDLGGDNGNMIKRDFKLIGQSDALILLESGYIYRYLTENQNIKQQGGVIENDWLYQIINYQVHDANITFNNFEMPFEYSGLDADMDSTGYDFFVSPYYQIKMFNTIFNLNQHLVFMPGSSFYMDKNSTLNCSYLPANSMSSISASGINIPTKNWQSSAGLTFLHEFYLMNSVKSFFELSDFYHEDGDNKGYENTEGYQSVIFQNRNDFWSNLAPAYGAIYGEINFIKRNDAQYNSIQFGGDLYIDNLQSFIENVNNANTEDGNGRVISVRLFSSTFKTDWCRIFGFQGTKYKKIYRNVTGYYNYPLVSNGYVLMDLKDSSGKTPNNYNSLSGYIYDWDSKIIYNSQYSYAFIFDTNDLTNLSYCNNLNFTNSLDGKYVMVSANRANKIISSEASYILYNGAYIPASGNGYSVSKFIDNSIYSNYLTWTFTYSNSKWSQEKPVG